MTRPETAPAPAMPPCGDVRRHVAAVKSAVIAFVAVVAFLPAVALSAPERKPRNPPLGAAGLRAIAVPAGRAEDAGLALLKRAGSARDPGLAGLGVRRFKRLFSGVVPGHPGAITQRMPDFALAVRSADPLPSSDALAAGHNQVPWASGLAWLAACVLAVALGLGCLAWRRWEADRRTLDRDRQRLHALLSSASDGLHVLDRNGVLLEFSDAFAAQLGRTRGELRRAHVSSWQLRPVRGQFDRMLHGFCVGETLDFSGAYRRADGSTLEVDVKAVGGMLDGLEVWCLAARDVTEQRRSLAALQASEAFLDRTGRIVGVGGWDLVPAHGRIQLTAQALHLLDLPPGCQPTLRACLRLFLPADRRRLRCAVTRSRLDGQPWDVELPATTRAGRAMWLRCVAEPVSVDDPSQRMTGAVQDVSDQRARTTELRREQKLRAELEQQGREQARMLRERGEMLDVLAHEVRQPLNNASAALQSASAALLELGEDVVRPRLLRAQGVMGSVMARIDNTLAVAALLARPGPIEREDTDIDTLVAVSVADMAAADRPRVQVRRETAARTVSMDMSLMRLALRNLLSNAMKYSPPGSLVTLRLADSEEPLGLLLDVGDEGGGVEPALRSRLFERGARGAAPASGTSQGLGLYIVRRVMELHGGQVQLIRTGPEGTTMRLVVVDAPDD